MKGGHGMRLIDADKLIELMIRDRNYAEKNGFMDMFYERQHLIGVIKKQPTIIQIELKRKTIFYMQFTALLPNRCVVFRLNSSARFMELLRMYQTSLM